MFKDAGCISGGAHEELPGLAGLEQGAQSNVRPVSNLAGFSARRNVRSDKSSAKGSRVRRRQFGIGLRAPHEHGVGKVFENRNGISERA